VGRAVGHPAVVRQAHEAADQIPGEELQLELGPVAASAPSASRAPHPTTSASHTGVSWERGLGDRDTSRLRIRPNVGLVELLDPVRRVGGAALSIRVALVYRADGPRLEADPTLSGS